MAKYDITLIPGDGIGPEVARAAQQIVAAAGVDVAWTELVAGAAAAAEYGTLLPQPTIDEIRRLRVGLKGPLGTPVGGGFASAKPLPGTHRDNSFGCQMPDQGQAGMLHLQFSTRLRGQR